MQELFFGPVAVWFSVPAIVGTVFFAIRTLAMLVGGDADFDADVDMDVAADVDVDLEGDAGDSSDAFQILSVQTIATFMMGFGWGGFAAVNGAGWSIPVSVAFAVACGVAMVWLLAKLLRFVYGLQSTGTLPMYHALEAEGTVYTTVPGSGVGSGRVRVVIGERERYYKAITDGEELRTNERVRVVDVNEDDNSVTVTKA